MKQQITSSKLRKPNGHFSQATAIAAQGKLVFISGMTARVPDGSIAGLDNIEVQTRQVCENVKAAVDLLGIQHHLAHGTDVVIVRPFNHAGPAV